LGNENKPTAVTDDYKMKNSFQAAKSPTSLLQELAMTDYAYSGAPNNNILNTKFNTAIDAYLIGLNHRVLIHCGTAVCLNVA
jgi:hypothetical protein